jgi:cytochrome c
VKPPGYVVLGVLGLVVSGCGSAKQVETVPGGDADRGKEMIVEYGCGGCHTIPGIDGADGSVGPKLDDVARRRYIAGQLENTPDNLVRWILDPKAIEPNTVMPDLGLTRRQARDVAAYLYGRT